MPRAPKRCGKGGSVPCDHPMPCADHPPSKNFRPSGRYPTSHGAERAEWAPKVAAGIVSCRRGELCLRYPDVRILPGAPWNLGHPDKECSAPTAPEHERCNLAAPGRLR